MTQIFTNQSLVSLNTFNVEATADYFCQIRSLADFHSQWSQIKQHSNKLVLGGGSNILFVGDFAGLVLHPQMTGITFTESNEQEVRVTVGASINWHSFVTDMLNRGLYGLENLALIPGTVGASPVQNIGAYGVEVGSVIDKVDGVSLVTGETLSFNQAECQFAYRDSLFKQMGPGRFLVTAVTFKLSRIAKLNLTYQPLQSSFEHYQNVTPQDVYDAVCRIRNAKLPNPEHLPNAGSFFKNPVVSAEKYQQLRARFPNLVAYPSGEGYKLAAGWLIDNAGFKGVREGHVGTHVEQALVIVNYGELQGHRILDFAQKIQQQIRIIYGVDLEPEVQVEGLNGKENHP